MMNVQLPRILPFKLIWKNDIAGEVESRRIILRKGRMESNLHIVLKVLAYCYYWDRNLIIEPRFRLNRYRPDLIAWRESEIPTKEELIPDLWIECKHVKFKKLIKLGRALPLSNVVWIHTMHSLCRTIDNIKSKRVKNQLPSNVQVIGIETSNLNWKSLEESVNTHHLQWKVTRNPRNSIEITIRGKSIKQVLLQFNHLPVTVNT
ncbi:MAG: hypothetical protein ACXADY_02485 [Candidatus Hodarchaeales archaeon]|jgi:hypothetical protein